MTEKLEKYVAKALEGYEQNYTGITDAIDKMEQQLKDYKKHQAEMLEGITEMKELLGLSDEEETIAPPLTLVNESNTSE